jgi:uncharacterized membrane protein
MNMIIVPTAISLHILAAVIWVGGMFFAHIALRPAANRLLEPPTRLPLMSQVLGHFFPWVWISIILLWITGGWLIFGVFGELKQVNVSIHIMMTLALIMTLIFVYIVFIPFPKLKQNITNSSFPEAAKYLAIIRQLIVTNLMLGLITIVVAAVGRVV